MPFFPVHSFEPNSCKPKFKTKKSFKCLSCCKMDWKSNVTEHRTCVCMLQSRFSHLYQSKQFLVVLKMNHSGKSIKLTNVLTWISAQVGLTLGGERHCNLLYNLDFFYKEKVINTDYWNKLMDSIASWQEFHFLQIPTMLSLNKHTKYNIQQIH